MLKAVIDTSVFTAGIISPTGASRRIIRAMSAGLFIPIACEETIEELMDVCQRPKFERFINKTETASLIETIHKRALIVRPAILTKSISEDPDDDIFLLIALTAKANCIVSFDNHLLDLELFREIPVVRPAMFLQKLGI